MFSTKSARLLIASSCVAILAVVGVSQFKNREAHIASTRLPVQPSQPAQTQPAQIPVPTETTRTQTSDAMPKKTTPRISGADISPITAFRHWAETATTVGLENADQNRGMELAKTRAAEMKELIKTDPASALRHALPAELRAALPPAIAATIEQPVKTSGMCSMRMMCNHSADAAHGNCEAVPVLLEEINSWNAHYDEQKWRSHLGQTVELDGIAVDEELAVQGFSPVPVPENQ